ncbi:MAG: winged helix DNA-binding protein [Rhodospirillaceae bacterium]|nr:winged helix DNA-binding protein [Rhodospirillaceae bacterium]MBL6942653.1 winged helix DNA-binding protein [Rhodospirillales bacterium]
MPKTPPPAADKDAAHSMPLIVSSEHLATEGGWQFSELEYGLIIAYNAFSRWMTRCMGAVGFQDFNPLDVLVLHNVNHRKRAKRLIDVAFVLNVEDQHTINYSLKKLTKAGLVEGEKRGKEMFYSTTQIGKKACAEYGRVRELCLISPATSTNVNKEEISRTAKVLRSTSGLYGQASRAAASL